MVYQLEISEKYIVLSKYYNKTFYIKQTYLFLEISGILNIQLSIHNILISKLFEAEV